MAASFAKLGFFKERLQPLRIIHALFQAFLPEKPHGYCATVL
jgi:hypothetical protein